MLTLGKLNFDRGSGDCRSGFRLDDVDVALCAKPAGDETPAQVAARLTAVAGRGVRDITAVRQFCADQLLGDKNSGWLKPGEAALSAFQFRSKLRLISLELGADDAVTLRFVDGGMFWGHQVVMEIAPDFSFDFATIEG